MTLHERKALVDRAVALPTVGAAAALDPRGQAAGATVETLALDRGRQLLAIGLSTLKNPAPSPRPHTQKRGSVKA